MDTYNFNNMLIETDFNSRKDCIVNFIKKHMVENKDYIKVFSNKNSGKKGGSGLNKVNYMLTDRAFGSLKVSYNIRVLDYGRLSLNHPIIPPIETASIGFICEVFRDFMHKKQFRVDKYFIDLYFTDLKLAVECDEDHHRLQVDRDIERQSYIETALSCKFYRFTPNKTTLSNIVYDIMNIIYPK